MPRWKILLALLGLSLPLGPARAAPALSVRLCIDYAPVYEDAGAHVGDDFLNERPTRVDATGAKVEISTDDGLGEHYGEHSHSKVLWSGHLNAAGCTGEFSANAGRFYQVKLTSLARIDGNIVELRTLGGDLRVERVSGLSFQASGEQTVTLPDSTTTRILAAITFGLRRQNPGLTGETISIWTKRGHENPCAGTSCNHRGQLYFQIDGSKDHTLVKNVLLHELGHKVMTLAADLDPGELPKDVNAGDAGRCPGGQGHRRNSVEWHPIAFVEGFGHFYASSVLNEPGKDCGAYSHYPVDWNHDGRLDGRVYSCDGPPVPGLGLKDADYLGQVCGNLSGMANEYDYQRFLWDLYSKEGLTVKNILDIFSRANRPTPWLPSYQPGSPNNASARLLQAARSLGFGEAWERQARANGVDR